MRLTKPRRWKNPGEKWGQCVWCGVCTDTDSEDYTAPYYPQSQLTRYKGKLYCDAHFSALKHEMMDEVTWRPSEADTDRGESI